MTRRADDMGDECGECPDRWTEDRSPEYLRGVKDCVDYVENLFSGSALNTPMWDELRNSPVWDELQDLREEVTIRLMVHFAEGFGVGFGSRKKTESKPAEKTPAEA